MPEGSSLIPDEYVPRSTVRRYPRRSLQDCMEATLGAGFIMGGIPMALGTGTTLGLCLGGPLPWTLRYSRDPFPTPVPPLFTTLQDTLGYEFHRSELLVEAVTHPSFRSAVSSSYQRLEFLGDALIDLVVMHYLFRKFPQATSGQLSWARSRAVCAPALASVAVKKLSLHQILLVNNVELSMAISKYVPVLEETTPENIVNHGWKHDPPKALSDVLESVMGAILVDSAYDYDRASVIAEAVMQDVLEVLSPDLPRDPVSELMISTARAGCRKMSYRKASSNPDSKRNDSISVIVHEIVIVGPVSAANLSLAKGRASEEARAILQDPEHEHYLPKVCQCAQAIAVGSQEDAEQSVDEDLKALDDETEEGFALMARKKLIEMESDRMKHEEDVEMYSGDDSADERTVEEMILNGL